MDRVKLKATTTDTDTDLGTFEAVASAWSTDREGDEIAPSAFDRTIEAWRRSEKYMPLLFEHTSVTVGWLDPEQMRTDARGLVVAGEVDRTSKHGEIAWRSIRQNTAGFSIGFVAEGRPRKGGKGRLITEIDLLEISWTATPVHPATRVLSWKSADLMAAGEQALDRETLLLESKVLAAETLEELGLRRPEPEVEPEGPEPVVGPRRALIFDGYVYKQLPADAPLASAEEIRAREQRQREQAHQAELIERARREQAEHEPPKISVHGLEVGLLRVNGQVVFDGERRR